MGDTADGRRCDGGGAGVAQNRQTGPAERERRKDSTNKRSFTAQKTGRGGGETEQVNQRTDVTGQWAEPVSNRRERRGS